MRIKSQLRFNIGNKPKKEQKALYQQYLIDPILIEIKKKIKEKVIRQTPYGNMVVETDLIVLTQKELVEILKKNEDGSTHQFMN